MKRFWRALQFWSVLLFAAAALCGALTFLQRTTAQP
jgi:hypothetical protein